jgi:hypothetical protein
VPRNRSNERLLLAGFADGATCRIDAAIQSGVGNDSSLPNMLDQLVLSDHAVGVLSQVKKKVEDLRLDMDSPFGALKLASFGIKHEIVKFYQQLRSLEK